MLNTKGSEAVLAQLPRLGTEGRGCTVLIVDDDPDARHLATAVLQRDGYSTVEADCADRALDAMRSRRVDLVILDLTLPGLPGLDLLTTLRRHDDVPVMIISGNNDVNTRVVGLRVGADDFLVKPVAPAEISARVSALLRRSGQRVSASIRHFGDLTIDGDAREVFLRNARVELTPKEFELLFFLSSRPRRAFSRQELLESVWQSSSEWQQAATVTEHVRKLRAKIEDDPVHPRWLVTVRNLGYRFDS